MEDNIPNLSRVEATWSYLDSVDSNLIVGQRYQGIYYDGTTNREISHGCQCIAVDGDCARILRAFSDITIIKEIELIPGEQEIEV